MKFRDRRSVRLFIGSRGEERLTAKVLLTDLLYAIVAGIVVGTAYYFFQNSNGFAPGGVGGLATITYYLLDYRISWSILMVAFNFPIFILVSLMVNAKLGFILKVYMLVQSLVPKVWEWLGAKPYCQLYSGDDFNMIFACILTGCISGVGFSIMLRRFGASGGTYGISALIKKFRPATNIAYVSFILDSCVVFIAFFVYGMRVTPVICTLLNLFIANVIVDRALGGIKDGYKFEIITDDPKELAEEIMTTLKHGVTSMSVQGMYTGSTRYMLVCIINKRQIGEMMKLIKRYPGTFASFEKVNEVFGNFQKVR